ncbi:hypothetical protein FN846DRAFT_889888 [Sphaerosporella brunnea]|uniref:HMG box domain-containing protein n=1 Tax=Sphaerosporella brunnea TaxID=1250544 RepID=A0A5J5EY80_9PEZI|nr:hypothetical protein FN846DRAFT_889888 [Sphaerosporella brunnea]
MPKEHKAKSPVAGPAPALPASVEESYRQKCKEIKKRILEIETSNELLTSRIQRARRAIQRMRLERAFLLEQLEKRTDVRVSDSDGSPSPPPTPSQKPLRVKRPRKDAPPVDSPMRQGSESPGPRDILGSRSGAGAAADQDYPFVNQQFVPPDQQQAGLYMGGGSSSTGKTPKGGASGVGGNGSGRSYNYRSRGGPKRPPNAYMIFCERERDAVRERESSKDGFDMHKALAQAWRDLKPEGQKPYFDEYERHKASYTAKVNELRDHSEQHGRQQRATSVGSSAAAQAFERGGSPVGATSTNDEDGDELMAGTGDADFSFSSRN